MLTYAVTEALYHSFEFLDRFPSDADLRKETEQLQLLERLLAQLTFDPTLERFTYLLSEGACFCPKLWPDTRGSKQDIGVAASPLDHPVLQSEVKLRVGRAQQLSRLLARERIQLEGQYPVVLPKVRCGRILGC